ncbi:MAG: hypothetical protein CM1200mP30_01590 [Pseudomonadota bacterium]|nr:MAG: hypothetical protein CM1200mP30_01590 [Pseudomonadota bacterium]
MDGSATNRRRSSILYIHQPMGESLVYLQSGLNNLLLSFGVCAVAGIIVGSFSSALIFRTFHFEWFFSLKDFMNHMIGAMLMGVGGVFWNGMYHWTGSRRYFNNVVRVLHCFFSPFYSEVQLHEKNAIT